ncbi:MAG: hypothetical protein C0480_18640 [Bradyrhizobium sp.]|nr:hypothetical protein [Bradyrhizobium sp.]
MLSIQAPPMLISFALASMFFKWKSFALECLGFLVLWFVLDAAYTAARAAWAKRHSSATRS